MSSGEVQAPGKVILAGAIAKSIQNEVLDGLSKLTRAPLLVGFLANKDPAARLYADWTGKTCEETAFFHSRVVSFLIEFRGFRFDLRQVDREDLESHLLDANQDDSIDGIIVYYPVFNSRQDQYLQQLISVNKDVEGLSHHYIFNMYQNIRYLDDRGLQKSILPCTPLAIVKILEYLKVYNTLLPSGNRLYGHTVTIVNRSEVVGRPLAALLANDGACVYSVDVTNVQQFTRGQGIKKQRHEVVDLEGWTLADCVPLSDVVVCGVPGQSFKFPVNLLKNGVVCINFSTEKNFSPEVKEVASIYVPAVGKVTIIILLRNLLRLIENKSPRSE
ncbi:MAG: hypothetical protein Q9214_004550 [Letrouitia sp. 1 TL-2023]